MKLPESAEEIELWKKALAEAEIWKRAFLTLERDSIQFAEFLNAYADALEDAGQADIARRLLDKLHHPLFGWWKNLRACRTLHGIDGPPGSGASLAKSPAK